MVFAPTHRRVLAAGLTWHYIEAGEGAPIVFLHGLPESWYSWHYQLEALSDAYHVIALDLKGYGQSDKADGNYAIDHVAEEILALLEEIGLEQWNLVTHDWGSLIGDFLAGRHPERVLQYVRMEAPLAAFDASNHPQFTLFRDQDYARHLFANAEAFVRFVYQERTVQAVPETDLQHIIEEFSRPGVAEAVPRYFRDMSEPVLRERAALYAHMHFPVLLLQGALDPAQPRWYFEGAVSLFPRAELHFIPDAGHFIELERPEVVTEEIRAFLRLDSGSV